MTIYVVSRNYIQYVFDEFAHMDTKMIGYGSLKRAYNGLLEINAGDLGGFIYVGDKITQQKSFALFLQRADMIANKGTTFMLALHDITGLSQILSSLKLKNLEVLLYEYDVLTDHNIRREIIAPVVMSKIKPFKLQHPKVVDPVLRKSTAFKMPEIFSVRFTETFSNLASMDSLNTAIEYDTILAVREPRSFWYELRMWYIYTRFNKSYKVDWKKYADELTDLEYCSVKYILDGSDVK